MLLLHISPSLAPSFLISNVSSDLHYNIMYHNAAKKTTMARSHNLIGKRGRQIGRKNRDMIDKEWYSMGERIEKRKEERRIEREVRRGKKLMIG